jgi:hypothetical protein
MMSELIWGVIVAASAIASVLVALPLLERWSSPPALPRTRPARPRPRILS